MNERIRKLAGECFVITDDGRFDYANEYMVQRFAELIVRECARIGELKEQGYSDYSPNISVGWYMRQHFGVEE